MSWPPVPLRAGDGAYTLSGVPPGRYTVLASLEGFDTQSREVVINAGVNVGQVFALPVGAVNEAVAVPFSMPQARPMFRSRGIAGGVAGGVAPAPPPFPPPPPPAAVDELMRAMESSAQAADLGDLFEYKLKQPVTIRRNQSALVPTVQSEVTVETTCGRKPRSSRGSARTSSACART
jgi:Carboxypeptidase regulatory-like domain